MKKALVNTSFLLAGLFALNLGFGQERQDRQDRHKDWPEPKFKKSKSYSKSYSLSSSDKINLENQFGEMKIMTWEKNEVKVDISITGKSDLESRAQEIIDRISITDNKSGNSVSFKTNFADEHKNSDRDDKNEHRNEGMEVNWTVYLPSGNALDADNQFGKMIVPDIRGEASLSSKFGSLDAGKISNAKEINVEFGSCDIAQMNGGQLSIKFSSGTVKKLSGDVKSNLEFSQVKLNLDNDLKGLRVDNSYSTVYLDLDRSFSASYDISTSMGEFTNKTSFPIKRQGDDNDNRYGPRFNEHYIGTSGGGAAKIRVSSSFGEIIAGHDMNVDLTEKHDKNKNKSKTKSI